MSATPAANGIVKAALISSAGVVIVCAFVEGGRAAVCCLSGNANGAGPAGSFCARFTASDGALGADCGGATGAGGGAKAGAGLAVATGSGVSAAGAFATTAGGAIAVEAVAFGLGLVGAGAGAGTSAIFAGAGIGVGAVSTAMAGFGFAAAFLMGAAGASGARRVSAPDEFEIDVAPTGGRRTMRPVLGCGGSMALRSTVTLEDDWPTASTLNKANADPNRTVRRRTFDG